jgi:N6-L-threonylcarbamoyladenine synthase
MLFWVSIIKIFCHSFTMSYILGIETSCDDTGIALINQTQILPFQGMNDQNIVENIVVKQYHKDGVIPEYAARGHHEALYENVRRIIAGHVIDLVAYTNQPGLIGSLLVGSSFAKGLAYSLGTQLMAVNHIEAHILLPFWLQKIEMPSLCMVISGGHTMIAELSAIGCYKILSETLDDAVGEMFDKVARHIGLPYPGGPEIERMAKTAKGRHKFTFPHVMKNRDKFSFSGLKTAAIMQIQSLASEEAKADFCCQLQQNVAELLSAKMTRFHKPHIKSWVISGGVASNLTIRQQIVSTAQKSCVCAFFPPVELCSDNGVMIAAAAALQWTAPVYDFCAKPCAS